MSNEIGKDIKSLLFGEKCTKCMTLGVRCFQVGLLTLGVPAETGQTVIYINECPALRTTEPIAQCPAITGKNSYEEVVTNVKKLAEKLNHTVDFGEIQPGNF